MQMVEWQYSNMKQKPGVIERKILPVAIFKIERGECGILFE